MSNTIKYNTSTQSNALRKGNFWIGTGDVDKGPTVDTGYYNSIIPGTAGYTFYLYRSDVTGNLAYHSSPSDVDMIDFTNIISATASLLPNGDFSTGVVTPWQPYNSVGGSYSVVDISSDRPYTNSTSTKAIQFNKAAGIYQSIPGLLTVGLTYSFSFWAKITSGTAFSLNWNNQNGSGDVNNWVAGPVSITQSWQRYTQTFMYNIAKNFFFFFNHANATGSTAIFTEFVVTPGAAPSGPGISTVTDALNWAINVPSDIMISNIDYEPIVTNGIILNVDAAFSSSYPMTGSVLFDSSPNTNNLKLINGSIFGTTSGVYCFKLDGINDRIDSPKDLNGLIHNIQYDINWTIECWMYMYAPAASPNTYKSIYANYSGCNFALSGNATGITIYNANNPLTINTNVSFGPKNSTASQCPDINIGWNNSESSWVYNLAINKWSHFVLTSDDGMYYKIYINGVQQGATKTVNFRDSQNRIDNNTTAKSNYSWGGDYTSNSCNQMDFSIIRMYNRPLTQAEVIKNFNSQKLRFGLLSQVIAQAHYDRVVADGGVVPGGVDGLASILSSIESTFGVTNSNHLNVSIPILIDPHYTGYKLGAGSGLTLGQAVQKVYSIDVNSDLIQLTAASQPLVLGWSGSNYFFASGLSSNLCESNARTWPTSSGGTWIVKFETNNNSQTGSLFFHDNAVGARNWGIQFIGKAFNFFFGSAFSRVATSSASVSNSFNGYIKVWARTVSSDMLIDFSTSTDGINYTQLGATITNTGGANSIGQNSATMQIGANGPNPGGNHFYGKIYRGIAYDANGNLVFDFDPSKYSSAASQTGWTSSTGEYWTINIGTASTGYKTTLVDRSKIMLDRTDDFMACTMSSNTIACLNANHGFGMVLQRNSSASNEFVATFGGDYTSDNAIQLILQGGGSLNVGDWNKGTVAGSQQSNTTATYSIPKIFSYVDAIVYGGTSTLMVNSVSNSGSYYNGTTQKPVIVSGNFDLGRSGHGNLNGSICTFILHNDPTKYLAINTLIRNMNNNFAI